MIAQEQELVEKDKEALQNGVYHTKQYNNQRRIFVPPSVMSTQTTRQMNLTNRTGRVANSNYIQLLYDVSAALITRMTDGKQIDPDDIASNARAIWMSKLQQDVPSIGIYGNNRVKRLPVSIGMSRRQPNIDCVEELRKALLQQYNELVPEHEYVLMPFGEACAVSAEPYMRFVGTGSWKPVPCPEYAEDTKIAWTCMIRMSILESLAALFKKAPTVAYCASACMQTHCPLALHITKTGTSNALITRDAVAYNAVYPHPSMACWAPRLMDMSHLLYGSGFFFKKSQKTDSGRRAQNNKDETDLHDINVILDQVEEGFEALQNILEKALPFKCVIRGLMSSLKKEEVDPSVGKMLLEFFYCSILGGYDHAEFRPCAIAMVHLYDGFFMNPASTEEMFEWFTKDRRTEYCDFVFDDSAEYRSVWDGHAQTDAWSPAHAANVEKPWDHDMHQPPFGAKKDVRSNDGQSLQKLFMSALQEMMSDAMMCVPALYLVVNKKGIWDKVMSSIIATMDTVRRSVNNALFMKHMNAERRYYNLLDNPHSRAPFHSHYIEAWPHNVFLNCIKVMRNRDKHGYYQWRKADAGFEAMIAAMCRKIDSDRCINIKAYQDALQNGVVDKLDPQIVECAMQWGMWDPHTLDTVPNIIYKPTFLATQCPPFVKYLETCKYMMDQILQPVEAPVWEDMLFLMWVSASKAKMLKEFHKRSVREPETRRIRQELANLPADEYTVVQFFYTYYDDRRQVQIIGLPSNIAVRQAHAVARKQMLPSVDQLEDSMSTVFVCMSCGTVKGYFADTSPRCVTAYGNKGVLIDPFTLQTYCGNKTRKPGKSKRNREQSELKQDMESGEMDDKTQRKYRRIYKSIAEAERKLEIKRQCCNTPLLPIPLVGVRAVAWMKNYSVCMSCGSSMQMSGRSYKGDDFTCGNCKPVNTQLLSIHCALCQKAYAHNKNDNEKIQSAESKRAELDELLKTMDMDTVSFPKPPSSWVKFTVFDDSHLYQGVEKPYVGHSTESTQGKMVQIYLCPANEQPWMLYEENLRWSTIYTRFRGHYVSWFNKPTRTYMPMRQNSQSAHDSWMRRMDVNMKNSRADAASAPLQLCG